MNTRLTTGCLRLVLLVCVALAPARAQDPDTTTVQAALADAGGDNPALCYVVVGDREIPALGEGAGTGPEGLARTLAAAGVECVVWRGILVVTCQSPPDIALAKEVAELLPAGGAVRAEYERVASLLEIDDESLSAACAEALARVAAPEHMRPGTMQVRHLVLSADDPLHARLRASVIDWQVDLASAELAQARRGNGETLAAGEQARIAPRSLASMARLQPALLPRLAARIGLSERGTLSGILNGMSRRAGFAIRLAEGARDPSAAVQASTTPPATILAALCAAGGVTFPPRLRCACWEVGTVGPRQAWWARMGLPDRLRALDCVARGMEPGAPSGLLSAAVLEGLVDHATRTMSVQFRYADDGDVVALFAGQDGSASGVAVRLREGVNVATSAVANPRQDLLLARSRVLSRLLACAGPVSTGRARFWMTPTLPFRAIERPPAGPGPRRSDLVLLSGPVARED